VTNDQFAELYQVVRLPAIRVVCTHDATEDEAEVAVQEAATELGAQIAAGRRLVVTPALFKRRAVDRFLDSQRRTAHADGGSRSLPPVSSKEGAGGVEQVADDDQPSPDRFERFALKDWTWQVRVERIVLDVGRAVDHLPDELTRQAVRLVWLGGQTYDQAAQVLRVRTAWIVEALGFARPLLQMALAQYDPRRRRPSVPAWDRQGWPSLPSFQQGRNERDYLGGSRGSIFRDAYLLAHQPRIKLDRAWTLGRLTVDSGNRTRLPFGIPVAAGPFAPSLGPAAQEAPERPGRPA
jgi:DNA-directed RNA polymerase specialized sigma24 family protein